MGYGTTEGVQVMWAFGVRVVGSAVDGKITAVVDRELILIEVLVLGEIWPTIELEPGRIRLPTIPHHEMSDTGEVALARQFDFAGQSRISWRNLRIVPQKLQNRQHPLLGKKATVAEYRELIRRVHSRGCAL